MNASPSLSLCMIVKNEADTLPACLGSVCPILDGIVLVDTGSSDGTVGIGRRFGATVLSFSWGDDFSEARNFSLDHATTDWILVLDADESIAQRDHDAIRSLLLDPSAMGYALEQRTYGTDPRFTDWVKADGETAEERGYPGYVRSSLLRLFRRDPRVRFEGKVHELTEHSFRRHGLPHFATGIPIHHYGKVRPSSRVRQKAEMYLGIGLEKSRQNPRDAKALCELGAQYIEMKELDKAMEAFLMAADLSPGNRDVHLNLGVILLRKGDFEEAEKRLRLAVSLDPGSADAFFNLAAVLLRLRRFEQAEGCLRRAMALRPGFGLAYATMGTLYLCEGFIEKAVPFLLEAVRINPGDADACSNIAWASLRLRRREDALQWCRKALALQPGHVNARNLEREIQATKNSGPSVGDAGSRVQGAV